jgi:CYTH domain-containing protein
MDEHWPVPFVDSWIAQTYLRGKKGTTERVRARHVGTRIPEYTHTIKRRVSKMASEEVEKTIDADTYTTLLSRKDPKCRTLVKKRRVFTWEDLVFELDFFPAHDMVVLEVELESEDQPVTLPPFLTIAREVSEDADFKNSNLAKRS